jgi:hypothetical protein
LSWGFLGLDARVDDVLGYGRLDGQKAYLNNEINKKKPLEIPLEGFYFVKN